MISRFWHALRNRFVSPNVDSAINVGECCARFIFSRGQFNSRGVKPQAFLPNPKNGETSVFITSRFAKPTELSRLKNKISLERDKQLYGEAQFAAGAVQCLQAQFKNCTIGLVLDETTHRHHANIVGWPADKSEQKLLAQALASHSEFKPE